VFSHEDISSGKVSVGNIVLKHLAPNERKEYPCITKTLKVMEFCLLECTKVGEAFNKHYLKQYRPH
jgi:hypothetical protein